MHKGYNISLFLLGVGALGLAVFTNIVFFKIKIPTVLGYIATGAIIINVFDLSGLASAKGGVDYIAELGIVFLMFMIGLEFSADEINKIRQEVLIFGTAQIILSILAIFLISYYILGFNDKVSLIIGFALSLSSTAIVLKIMGENKQMDTIHGKANLGILIMQDIAVIPILLMISLMSNADQGVAPLILKTLVSATVVCFLLFVPIKAFISFGLKNAANTKMDEIFVGAILFIVLSTAGIAHYFGFSYSLGAFIAGMIISGTFFKHRVEADLSHFRDLLLGFFFVTVGFQVDIIYMVKNIPQILGILAVVLILKTSIIFAVIRLFRDAKTSLKTALSLCQVGEFSFAIFALAQANNLIDSTIIKPFILAIVLSMIFTPFILNNMGKIVAIFVKAKLDEEHQIAELDSIDNSYDKIIVCGYGRFGKETVKKLKYEGYKHIIAIDYNLKAAKEGKENGDIVIFGNITQGIILNQLDLGSAMAIIVAIDDIKKAHLLCQTILDKEPNANLIVKVSSLEEVNVLSDLNINKIVNEREEVVESIYDAVNAIKQSNLGVYNE